ncbi:partner of Y14 and mago-like [Procambarus clarkii]|uniref:partner of Y14 and mago-like n=1 Tax=Procambarus clarkii TaxID=6728 RepID=UPI0037439F51
MNRKEANTLGLSITLNWISSHTGIDGNENADSVAKTSTALPVVQGGKQPSASDPTKRLRNLKKKLRDIEKLEKQIASGELKNPEPEQLEKVKKKDEVIQQIDDLEDELGKSNSLLASGQEVHFGA